MWELYAQAARLLLKSDPMKEGEEDVQQVGEAVGGVPRGGLGAAMGGAGHARGVEGGATEAAALVAAGAVATVATEVVQRAK